MKEKIIVSNNTEEISTNFFNLIKKTSDEITDRKISFALSGGSSPKIIFNNLVNNFKNKLDWNNFQYFWGDERCVPPSHEESNYKMAFDNFLNPLNVYQENIFRIYGEDNPMQEAIRYQEILKKNILLKNEIPVFDINLMGLGEDGHTASIFPNQLEIFNSDNICEEAVHPVSHQKRITITGKVINHSSKIIMLVTGKKKSEKVKEIILRLEKSKSYPASLINPNEGTLIWLLDKESASLL